MSDHAAEPALEPVPETAVVSSPDQRTWWRQNARALVVVSVLLPALVFVLLGLPLIDIASRETTIVEVRHGETIEAGGYSWTVVDSREFVGTGTDENGIPTGASIVAAIIAAEPVEGSALVPRQDYCDAELTSRDGLDEEQVWLPESNPAQYRYQLSENSTNFCALGDRESFEFETVFLTPVDAFEHATVDIRFFGESTILRLALTDRP